MTYVGSNLIWQIQYGGCICKMTFLNTEIYNCTNCSACQRFVILNIIILVFLIGKIKVVSDIIYGNSQSYDLCCNQIWQICTNFLVSLNFKGKLFRNCVRSQMFVHTGNK